ncbi:MAG: hypothetical protein Q4Q03_03690, partial [Bowdeniella nasicola]|nr:hypothetical protein [Bowdeniella nasicola]
MNEIARRPIPRRTVAKGAAWAVPAVVVGSSAAANTQVSPDPDEPIIVNCPTSPEELCYRNYATDKIGGARTAQWVLPPKGPKSGPGTKFGGLAGFTLGTWKFDKACLPQGYYADGSPAKLRFYKMNTGKDQSIKIRTVKEDPNGTLGVNYTWAKGKQDYWGNDEWEGYFATRPDGLARSVTLPIGFSSFINSNMPYSSTITNPAFGLGKP